MSGARLPAGLPADLPPGPWRAEEMGRLIGREEPAWIRILDGDSRKVCDVTVDASVGSQGIGPARAIAAWIVQHSPKGSG